MQYPVLYALSFFGALNLFLYFILPYSKLLRYVLYRTLPWIGQMLVSAKRFKFHILALSLKYLKVPYLN